MSTIICPICNTVSPAGAIFCDNCGYDLRKVTPASPPPPPSAPPTVATPTPATPATPAGTICPSCGHENIIGSLFCENCGVRLSQQAQPQTPPPPPHDVTPTPATPTPAQPPYPPPPPQQAVPPAPHVAQPEPPVQQPQPSPAKTQPGRLIIQGSNVSLQIPSGKQEVIIGREDPVSSIFPDIDLDPYGGQDAGVGRQHAKITQHANQYFIEDLNSVNGTSINKQRIPPRQPVALNDGDEIRLGLMVLNFYSH